MSDDEGDSSPVDEDDSDEVIFTIIVENVASETVVLDKSQSKILIKKTAYKSQSLACRVSLVLTLYFL